MDKLNQSDKDKVNGLYLTLNHAKLNVPDFENPDAQVMGTDIKEGLDIIMTTIKEVAKIINK